jgi:LmbE family N-acetylglucosaminyl deacetylase
VSSPTLLVAVAHPDDETFGCGSLLMHAKARGARTVVVCATRGEAGEIETGVVLPPGGLGELRESELRASAAALGVDAVEVLGFADSGLAGEAGHGTLCGSSMDDLTELLSSRIEHYQADIVVTLDGSDGHRDHVRVRDGVIQVVGDTDAALYLHCLPRSLMHAWVRHHSGDADKAAYTTRPDIGTPDDELTTIIDTTDLLPRRRAAIALHASQTSPFEGLPDDVQRAWLGREHLVRLNPPWEGGLVERELMGL